MNSLKGQLILDGGQLTGSEFQQSVLLVCAHNAEGAHGLILNRPSPHPVREGLPIPVAPSLGAQPLYLGGPVRPEILSCLVFDPTLDAAETEGDELVVLPGLRLVHHLDDLLDDEGAIPAGMRIQFYAGYAGWAPGQLDNEIQEHAWLTHPASMDQVFDPRPETLWRRILRTKGPQYRLLAEMPDDVSRN